MQRSRRAWAIELEWYRRAGGFRVDHTGTRVPLLQFRAVSRRRVQLIESRRCVSRVLRDRFEEEGEEDLANDRAYAMHMRAYTRSF